MSERIIEPSDTERSEWPDTTREYVEAIEANTEQLERELAEFHRTEPMKVAERNGLRDELGEARQHLQWARETANREEALRREWNEVARQQRRRGDEARSLCRDLYAYAESRTPDSRNTCPYTEFGKLRTRLRVMEGE